MLLCPGYGKRRLGQLDASQPLHRTAASTRAALHARFDAHAMAIGNAGRLDGDSEKGETALVLQSVRLQQIVRGSGWWGVSTTG